MSEQLYARCPVCGRVHSVGAGAGSVFCASCGATLAGAPTFAQVGPNNGRFSIFISYRRKDTKSFCYRMYDALLHAFDANSVFIDIDGIGPGRDFRAELDHAIGDSSVLLVTIGERWLEKKWLGTSRLNDVTDLVRLEIEWALRSEITIIPILVGDAKLPRPSQLPASLAELSRLQAMHVDEGKDFHNHMYRLILILKELQQKELRREH